jgi:hypothetical protein
MFFFYLLCHKLLSLRHDFQESFPLKLQWPSALSMVMKDICTDKSSI